MPWVRTIFFIVLAAIQAAAIVGSRLLTPEDGWFHASIWALGVTAVVTPLAGIVQTWRATAAKIRLKAKDAIDAALMGLLAKTNGVSQDDVGIHVYALRRPWLVPWRPEHIRIATIRPSGYPLPSMIPWTRGKGVVGQCWADPTHVHHWRRRTSHDPYFDCTEERWRDLTDLERMGFSFTEWQAAKRFAGVLASPVLGMGRLRPWRAKYLGCVTLDFVKDDDYVQALAVNVQALIVDAANEVARALRGGGEP